MKRMRFILLLILIATSLARADTTVRLLTDGYYRPGKFMPVAVQSDAEVTLSADGAVPTVVKSFVTHRTNVFLILSSSATELRWTDTKGRSGVAELKPLTSRQRLVGFNRLDDSAAGLFPGEEIIPVRVGPGEPFSGGVSTWESLDAVVVDKTTFDHHLRSESLNLLLAAGTIVAVRSEERPDDRPWSRPGNLWVLEVDLSGPASAGYSEAAYLPTWGWSPGRSQRLRTQVILAAIVLSLLTCGCMLLGRRSGLIALIILVAGSLIAIFFWRRAIPPLAEARGGLRMVSETAVQTDQYLFQQGIETSEWSVDIEGAIVRPILLGPNHLDSLKLVLEDDVHRRFRYTLPAGGRVAFLSRRIDFASPDDLHAKEGSSRLDEMVRQLYLTPEVTREGIIEDGDWNTVVLRK